MEWPEIRVFATHSQDERLKANPDYFGDFRKRLYRHRVKREDLHTTPESFLYLGKMSSFRFIDEFRSSAAPPNVVYSQWLGYLDGNQANSILFADTMSSMGVAYRHTSDFQRSDSCFARAKEIYEQHTRSETPEYAKLLVNIAFLRVSQGQNAAATQLLCEARDVYLTKSSADADALVRIQLCEGHMFRVSGEIELAQITLEAAREVAREKLGSESFMYAKATAELGELYLSRNETTIGIQLYSEALKIWDSKGGGQLIDRMHAKRRIQEISCL